jgi:hypothetical protein
MAPRLGSSILLALAVVAALAVTPAHAAGNARAAGGGTFQEEGAKSTFTFNAVQHQDGSVNGHLEYNLRAEDLTFTAKIDCLDVRDNVAVLGGRISKAETIVFPDGTTLEIPKGTPVVFAVEDNGQGRGAAPDRVSNVRIDVFFPGPTCDKTTDRKPLFPISGNIQVQA